VTREDRRDSVRCESAEEPVPATRCAGPILTYRAAALCSDERPAEAAGDAERRSKAVRAEHPPTMAIEKGPECVFMPGGPMWHGEATEQGIGQI
jgi:hypothetical protein